MTLNPVKWGWLSLIATICLVGVLPRSALADMLVSQNLGDGAYSASNSWQMGYTPELAFDGDSTTMWNAGTYSTQWVEVDLQQPFDITGLILDVAQLPDGDTTHEVWVSNSPMQDDLSGASLAQTLSGYTQNHQILELSFAEAINAEFVQVRTTSSPSWVAWWEVQVYATDSPFGFTANP